MFASHPSDHSCGSTGSGSTLVMSPSRQFVPSSWCRSSRSCAPVPEARSSDRQSRKRVRERLSTLPLGSQSASSAPKRARYSASHRIPSAPPPSPTREEYPQSLQSKGRQHTSKRERSSVDDSMDCGMDVSPPPATKRRCIGESSHQSAEPGATIFPWSRQQGWRDVVDALPRESTEWARRVVADFDQHGPDVPILTIREVQHLMQDAVTRAEARGRRLAEQQLETHRLALQRQQQSRIFDYCQVGRSLQDYRSTYIS